MGYHDKENAYFYNKVQVNNNRLKFHKGYGKILNIRLEICPKISWA